MSFTPRQWLTSLAGLLAILAAAWASPAQACVICIPYPTTTHADLLMESEVVVIAREDPDKSFSYAPVVFLKGKADTRPVDLLLDSLTRQRLSHSPDDGVVLYRRSVEAPWMRLAYANAAYREFLVSVLENTQAWESGRGKTERLEFFSQRMLSADATIQEQAYLEVGRAPYTWISRVAGAIPREEIRRFLSDDRKLEWHRLFILMLARSAHPDDRVYIRKEFESAAHFGLTATLPAWTVAFVEAYPETAVEEIEESFFRAPARSRPGLEAVLQGLSVLASQEGILISPRIVELRRRIVRSYARLIEQHPQLAGWVARDLTLWQLQALVERLSAIVREETTLDPAARFMVESYLAVASGFPLAALSKQPR